MCLARRRFTRAVNIVALLAAGLCSGAEPGAAKVLEVRAESVKAAFLCQFLLYIEWPGESRSAGQDLTIGVLGAEDLYRELQLLVAGRKVNGRAVRTRLVHSGDALQELELLFVGADAIRQLPTLLQEARQHHIVLITDTASGLERGSVINFVLNEQRVRFDISMPAAQRTGVKLSSRLLAVAQNVHTQAR